MRPWRQVFALSCCLFAVISILYNSRSSAQTPRSPYDTQPANRLSAFFSFRTPGSLFPLNALISLTYENSTFFSARPANFGPFLPANGLNGQLWIGNGFGDGILKRRGIATGSEGELGCSDVPGLPNGEWLSTASSDHSKGQDDKSQDPQLDAKRLPVLSKARRSSDLTRRSSVHDEEARSVAEEDDGTDDYLHRSLTTAVASGLAYVSKAKSRLPEHADIQSIQESAEINGKIVLLSRGGCGFFEKVKWAQRRGAIAVIVADIVPGGPLVTMNARGDTSNITIPSVFTHHTTAHILASLIPPGFDSVKPSLSKAANSPSFKQSKVSVEGSLVAKKGQPGGAVDQRTFTRTTNAAAHTPTVYPSGHTVSDSIKDPSATLSNRPGWLSSFWSFITFGYGGSKESGRSSNSRRPPSSGNLDWYMVEDWDSDEPKVPGSKPSTVKSQDSHDDFVIGVQDWRDPDVVSPDSTTHNLPDGTRSQTSSRSTYRVQSSAITPGSGEYAKPSLRLDESTIYSGKSTNGNDNSNPSSETDDIEGAGWLHSLGWGSAGTDMPPTSENSGNESGTSHSLPPKANKDSLESFAGEDHQGLWVTLTPSSISTSPFFDTLVVLVISPLVTLTIVYAMLLVRSRIRRRRWRAPKSVVDQLPVRTYHTQSTRSSSPGPGTSTALPCTSTTPLLTGSRQTETRSRPRSRTIGGSPENLSAPNGYGSLDSSVTEQEKLDAGLAEWRRRYGGKQVECIVCLEEYVDGISKVMSLPCGHEFHADCITPWLTTRRRTCPICKGDVVRSMTKNSMSMTHSRTLEDESDEDFQTQAAETRNDSPSAAMPITSNIYDSDDIEQGDEQTLASRSLPTLRIPRNIRNGLHALRLHRGGRTGAIRQHSPVGEDRDR